MTGLSETGHVVQGLAAGGVDYVTKPIVIDELLARIRVHLANARVAFGARTALDTTGRCLVATDETGQMLWCTPLAERLLDGTLLDPETIERLSRLRQDTVTGQNAPRSTSARGCLNAPICATQARMSFFIA